MISNKDSLGNILTNEQIEYFKNTKIVDKNNNLLVCYHGSPNPGFKEFNPRDNKSQFGKYKFGNHNVNYFTTDKRTAASYTEFGYDNGTVYQVYINITNPFIVDNKSEAEIKSSFNIKDERIRKQQINLFNKIFNKWKDKILDYSDYRMDELNNDLHKLNLELRPSDTYDSDTDPELIELFDLYDLGKNSFFGTEHPIFYQYYTEELFSDDMYNELKDAILGENEDDYLFSTDDIVRYVLSLDENYDGIIIEDIYDSKEMFSNITTDIITLNSPNQIKSIDNKTPTTRNRIDEKDESKLDDIELDFDDIDLDLDDSDFELDDIEDDEVENDNYKETDEYKSWHDLMMDTINQSRRLRKGLTLTLPDDDKEYLKKNYPDYSFKVVNLKDVIEKNHLDNPEHGTFSRRTYLWGEEPELYWYSKDKDNERYNPIRLTSDLRIMDGNHRLWALYNMGYAKAEVLVYNSENLTESLLLEVNRNQMISKSKRGDDYAADNQDKGRNRWERKKWSRVSSSVREFNSIDMNAFFKKDILNVIVPVRGETDDYKVKIKFSGVLKEIRENVKKNNNKLDYRTISQSLTRVFNSDNIFVHCSCSDWRYRMGFWATRNDFNSGPQELIPSDETNPYDTKGGICKHVALVISNLSWLMKVTSVINNYIHFAETNMQRQFADIIFPAIYGVEYPEAIQLGMFDRKYLKHSKGVIDEINALGKVRGRFKSQNKPTDDEPDVAIKTFRQPSIFNNKENETSKESEEEKGINTQETPKKGFKPKESTDNSERKKFKQPSIFDDNEKEGE